GCPLDLSPAHDNTVTAADPEHNNNFTFTNGEDLTRCPVTSHIRKTAPRISRELSPGRLSRYIVMRTGIPYGPEIHKFGGPPGPQDRGLLFTAYQSTLSTGFTFLQQAWACNAHFPFGRDLNGPSGDQQLIPENPADLTTGPGYDPIIGARSEPVLNAPNGRTRFVRGQDPNNLNGSITVAQDWIRPRGGEYFWVPSMDALKMIARDEPMRSKEEDA
ncbi:hypothetical protein FRB90_005543, partial [Tulasnella sp. 427]